MSIEARRRTLVIALNTGEVNDKGEDVLINQRFSKLTNNATEAQYIGLKDAVAPILKYPVEEIFEEQVNIIVE